MLRYMQPITEPDYGMNEKQIKRTLEDAGIRISDVARHMARDFPITLRSADAMLRQLISGTNWYPKYVLWLKAEYKITVGRPPWLRPARERMKAAA